MNAMNDTTLRELPGAVTRMRSVIAGGPRERLERLAAALRVRSPQDAVVVGDDDPAGLAALVARSDPDLLLLLKPQAGAAELDAIERLGRIYPGMSPVLLCDSPSPEFLMQAMRAGVREILPSASGEAEVLDVVRRIGEKLRSQPERRGQVLAFISCKGGGGGATFLSCNLAYALASLEEKSVLLVDLNLQWGDAVFFLSDRKPSSTLSDVATQIHRVDLAFLTSSLVRPHPNLGVLAAPEDPVRALDVRPEHIDVLIRLARAHFDYVVLDTGRALDAVTVRALDYADSIFTVLQASLPFVRDGKRLLGAFRTLEYPDAKIRLLVNRHEKGKDVTLQDVESALGRKAYRTFPNDYERVSKSINQGIPIVQLAKTSAIARSIAEFAHELASVNAKPAGGWLDRVLGRA
jgi:pilus assembly protein CpaE